MNYLTDKKSWLIAALESFGILAFNAAFGEKIYAAIGSTVPTSHVVAFSIFTFFLRIGFFYSCMVGRIYLEKKEKR